VLKVIGDTAQVTSPLILKVGWLLWLTVCFPFPVTFTLVFQPLIKFATDSSVAHREGIPAPGLGEGIGPVIALNVILELL